MSSRMDRYSKENTVVSRRTKKNQRLYKSIYEDQEYSNIEGIATIEDKNKIDINKIKNMIKNYEEKPKAKQSFSLDEINYKEKDTNIEEEKNYDIRQLLDSARSTNQSKEEYKTLNQTSYDIFKDLRDKRRQELNIETEEDSNLKELINTIANTGVLNNMGDKELSLDLLDDLKSSEDTIKVDNESIKSVLEEAKKAEKAKETTNTLDKSFYSETMGFKDDDFEQLAAIKNGINKNNWLLRITLILVALVIMTGIGFLVFNLLK